MKQFTVTGMSCAACSARVEKAVKSVDGVCSCAVSLLTNSLSVDGNVDEDTIIQAVVDAGYGASVKDEAQADEELLKDTQTPKLVRRLIPSILINLVLLYFMGHMIWNWPLPACLIDQHLLLGTIKFVLAGAVIIINRQFFINGTKGIINKSPNMDTLVSLGAGAAYIYSIWALVRMYIFVISGAPADASISYYLALPLDVANSIKPLMYDFYFDSSAMILTLISVGKLLESRAKGKTTDALKSLIKLKPNTALILQDGEEKNVPVAKIKIGDTFLVKPGETIPVDGEVIEGTSAVNESALTGESIPADKTVGDQVSAATINQSGRLVCKATRVGEDTTLSKIIKLVGDAAATKAPIARIADKVSGIFVPTVISIAIVTFLVWYFVIDEQTVVTLYNSLSDFPPDQSTAHFSFSLARAISVLVVSCPCALGLATPVAIIVGNGVGAKNGILFKTAAALEACGRVNTVILDKTGTITSGTPEVTDLLPADGVDTTEFLKFAASAETGSEHPLAIAIVQKAHSLTLDKLDSFTAIPGRGLEAHFSDYTIYAGNADFAALYAAISEQDQTRAHDLADHGKTPLFFVKDNTFLGIIAVADTIRKDSTNAIKALHELGLKVVMLTGDNEKTANAIAKQAGVDDVIAGVLPDGKEAIVRKYQQNGKVAMVGDGINDAPALTRADVGIAIGAGTDIAIDAADVVLMKSRLSDVTAAIQLSRATLRNIHQNLFWAFCYNVLGIPLAAGVFIPLTGWVFSPILGALAMSFSSFSVVSNALRLKFAKLFGKDVPSDPLTRNFTVTGMHCGHCEASVTKALLALDGVKAAEANHDKNRVLIHLENEDVSNDVLTKAIEDCGFKVEGIK